MRFDVNGMGINVQDTGDGPAVLLTHGWPDTYALWRHQVAALTAAGYRAVAPDLRGFGDSDKPAAIGDYGIFQLISDLLGCWTISRCRGRTSSGTTGAARSARSWPRWCPSGSPA
jgi:pimeloyl-ACP methyl ester carboxylesterase